jgi:hypothetical protein
VAMMTAVKAEDMITKILNMVMMLTAGSMTLGGGGGGTKSREFWEIIGKRVGDPFLDGKLLFW